MMLLILALIGAAALNRDVTTSRTPTTTANGPTAQHAHNLDDSPAAVDPSRGPAANDAVRVRDVVTSRPGDSPIAAAVRFASVDLIIDAADTPLAVYQLEFTASKNVAIVGIEGGHHPAFKDAPHYDPAAIQGERVIIAAFSTAENLPSGKVRVATIHLQITGDADPEYHVKTSVTATAGGKKIDAPATVETKRTQS